MTYQRFKKFSFGSRIVITKCWGKYQGGCGVRVREEDRWVNTCTLYTRVGISHRIPLICTSNMC